MVWLLIGLFILNVHQVDIEGQSAKRIEQDIERCGEIRLTDVLAFDDRVKRGGASENIVGLHGQHFAKDMSGTITLERPHFHFSETLSSSLRLSAERLLRDKGVRADGAQ